MIVWYGCRVRPWTSFSGLPPICTSMYLWNTCNVDWRRIQFPNISYITTCQAVLVLWLYSSRQVLSSPNCLLYNVRRSIIFAVKALSLNILLLLLIHFQHLSCCTLLWWNMSVSLHYCYYHWILAHYASYEQQRMAPYNIIILYISGYLYCQCTYCAPKIF